MKDTNKACISKKLDASQQKKCSKWVISYKFNYPKSHQEITQLWKLSSGFRLSNYRGTITQARGSQVIPLLNFYNKQIKHTWWSPSHAKNVYQKFWNVYSTIIELFSHILLSFDLLDKCTACHSFSLCWDAHCLLNTWGYKSTNTRLRKRTNIPTIVPLFCNNLGKKFGPAKLKKET